MSSERSVFSSVELSEVVAAFIEGRATTTQVLEAFYKDRSVLNVISNACKRVGLEAEIEDVRQNVGAILADKLLNKMIDAPAIYGVIKQTTKYLCIDLIRRNSVRPEQSLDAIIEGVSGDGDSSSIHELIDTSIGAQPEKAIERIDKQRAIDMFNLRLQNKISTPSYEVFLGPSAALLKAARPKRTTRVAKPAVSVPKKNDTQADRLIQIRDTLAIPNEDFGRLLGLSDSMLCFYLYNSRRRIPQKVMDEANTIMGQMDPERLKAAVYLSKTKLADVVTGWMRMLAIDPDSKSANQDFGEALGVSRSTVWRWRTENHVPKMSFLVRSHLRVQQLQAEAGHQRNAEPEDRVPALLS